MGKKFMVILVACCVLIPSILAGACTKAPVTEAPEKSLTVAFSSTFTGSMGATGAHVCTGNMDYFRWVAGRGGIEYKDPASGRTEKVAIKIVWEDVQFDVAKSTAAYKRFRAAGASVIYGFGSTPEEACAAFASRDKIPLISWYAYASPQGYAPKPQYYFTAYPMIAESSTTMLKWLIKERLKGTQTPKIGFMVGDLPSWRPIAKPGLLDGYINSIGGELAGIEFVPPLITDVSVPLTRLVTEKKADGLILIGSLDATIILARDSLRIGIDPSKVPIVMNPSAWDESLLKFREMEGLYGENGVSLPGTDVPGMKVVRDVAAYNGRSFENIAVVNSNYIQGLAGSIMLEEAMKRALNKDGYDNVAKSGESLRNQLANFTPMETGGLVHSIGVKYPDIEPFFMNYDRITEAKGGKLIVVSDWISMDLIKGALDY